MKTQPPDQEKILMLVMIFAYWITILIICWFSYESIMQFIMHIFSQAEITMFSKR